MSHPDYEALVATAHALADAAREPILRHFRAPQLSAENKDKTGFDPVTIADREAEAAMRAILAERRPDDAILGEEHGRKSGSTGPTWVLDPIDGTRAFIAGAPVFGVLIAVHDGTRPILGVIDQPYIGERFLPLTCPRSHAKPRRRYARPVHAQDQHARRRHPAEHLSRGGTEADRAGFQAVAAKARLTRYGLDCYGYALVALGQADLVIEAGLQLMTSKGPWRLSRPQAAWSPTGGASLATRAARSSPPETRSPHAGPRLLALCRLMRNGCGPVPRAKENGAARAAAR